MDRKPIYYSEYLKLEKFLTSQAPITKNLIKEEIDSHDEMLFIIVHQAYELWFKQIIHELSSVMDYMNEKNIVESKIALIVHRLKRIIKIQGLFVPHIEILETMTPMDFLEFRDYLVPASGFQSVQFREVEIRLGLSTQKRFSVDRHAFLGRLNEKDRAKLEKVERLPNMLTLLNKWLERMPFIKEKNFNFWSQYQETVKKHFETEKNIIQKNRFLSDLDRKSQLINLKSTVDHFKLLFDETSYQELIKKKRAKLSQKAILSALFILLYRDRPILHMPYQLLTALMDIDENFTSWRYRHALLAKRMLGSKIGTGGTSGHEYLKKAADNNRVFEDLFNLSSFLIPRSGLPKLPDELEKRMGLYFQER